MIHAREKHRMGIPPLNGTLAAQRGSFQSVFFFAHIPRDRNCRDRLACMGWMQRIHRQNLSHGKRLAGFLPATAQPPVSDKAPVAGWDKWRRQAGLGLATGLQGRIGWYERQWPCMSLMGKYCRKDMMKAYAICATDGGKSAPKPLLRHIFPTAELAKGAAIYGGYDENYYPIMEIEITVKEKI